MYRFAVSMRLKVDVVEPIGAVVRPQMVLGLETVRPSRPHSSTTRWGVAANGSCEVTEPKKKAEVNNSRIHVIYPPFGFVGTPGQCSVSCVWVCVCPSTVPAAELGKGGSGQTFISVEPTCI